MREHNNSKPRAWLLYELGRNYNEQLTPSQYDLVETNVEFFVGNQWLRLPNNEAMAALPKPTFNILKRVASLFIASLTSSGVTLRFEPLAYYDGTGIVDPQHDVADLANASVKNLLDKFRFDREVRAALFDGAQTGDYCAHFYFDPDARPYGGSLGQHRGEIKMERLDGINVMFGNPNTPDVQSQPYILLVGRKPVSQLKWEAERFRKRTGEKNGPLEEITADNENDLMPGVGGKTEILPDGEGDGKALYVILYTKVQHEEVEKDQNGDPVYEDKRDEEGDIEYETDVNGNPVLTADGEPIPKRVEVRKIVTTVYATQATRSAVIYEDIDTGLSLYPVAWGNWEKQKNQYHGRALVTGLIPNQIYINSMFAMALRHMQLTAFPKTVYNADLITSMSNDIGKAIAVRGLQPGQSISQVAMNLNPAEMSNQIFTLIDKVMAYTKECLGATDAQLGNVKPDNTSALMVLQTNSEVPLENIRSGVYDWAEDIGEILLDMMGTYYGNRPVVVEREFTEPVESDGVAQIDPMTGLMRTQRVVRKVVEDFDFGLLKHIALDMRIDVGATNYFSEIAMTQTLDNLRKDGTLDVLQYLKRIPDKLIPQKVELIKEIESRMAAGMQANAAAGAALPEPGSPMTTPPGQLSPELAAQGLPGMAEKQMAGDELPNIARKTVLAQGAKLSE